MGWDNPPVPWRELERRLSWGTGEDPGDAEQDPRPVTRLPARAHHGPPWAELHCHSSYSFLDGASSPAELVAEAARLGLEALAITDHNGMYGVPQFAQAAAKLTEQTGIKLGTVFGAELSVGGASPGEHAAFPGASPRTPGPWNPSVAQGPVPSSRGLAVPVTGPEPPIPPASTCWCLPGIRPGTGGCAGPSAWLSSPGARRAVPSTTWSSSPGTTAATG